MFTSVLAANGVVDILQNDSFQGSANAAADISSWVNEGFSFFISLVAFFMISVALLRNVLAGAYCAFPKFWDQVDQAHKDNQDKAFYAQITGMKEGYKNVSMGTIKIFIFRIIPNIKCLTEFADETEDGKKYFLKAIPEMLGVVCLGVFIYNGYWRDAAGKVAEFGGTLFQRVLLDWDPVEAFDAIANTAGRPVFATDGALTDLDKNKNKLAEEMYHAIMGKYGDITSAAAKADLASQIDTHVEEVFSKAGFTEWYSDNSTYNVSIKVDAVVNSTIQEGATQEGTIVQYVGTIGIEPDTGTGDNKDSVSSTGTIGKPITITTNKDARKEGWQLQVMLKSEKRKLQGDAVTSTSGTLTIPMTGQFTLYSKTLSFTPPTISNTDTPSSTKQTGSGYEATYTIKPPENIEKGADNGTAKLKIRDTEGKNSIDVVLKVVWGDSASISYSDGITPDTGDGGKLCIDYIKTATEEEEKPAETTSQG